MNKKIAAGVAVTVAAASIATNLAFQPDELLHDEAWLETHTRFVQTQDDEGDAIEYTEPEELGKKDLLRLRLLKLPVPVKALLLLPLWILGALPAALVTGLASAASPILAQLLAVVLQAAILLGVFCAVYKLIFPERKLRELFQKKNRRWLILGAVLIVLADFGLSLVFDGWPVVRVVLMALMGFLVLTLLWRRICGRLRGPEPGVVHTKLKLEY